MTDSQILFAGGSVFDGRRRLAGHDVLVTGERIERLAPAAVFEGFTGRRIDIAGCTLMPGLIDCHVHLCYSGEADPGAASDRLSAAELALRALHNAQQTLAGGVTAVRDCGGKDYIEFAVRDACNSGRFRGPVVRAAGRMICMTGGHGNRIGRIADGPAEVVKAVREQIHAGCDFCKLMATGGVMTPGVNPEDAHYSLEELAAGVGEARRFHRPSASHAQGAEGILNAVRAGVDSIEHGIFLDETGLAEMLERGTYLVPTCSALHHIIDNPDAGIPEYVVVKAQRVAERQRRSLKMFAEAGGRLAMGTDAGTPFNRHGENAQELRLMVESGVTAEAALIAATAAAAELLRLDDRGRVAERFLADLLIVEGDPCADIDAAADPSRHRWLVKTGQAQRL